MRDPAATGSRNAARLTIKKSAETWRNMAMNAKTSGVSNDAYRRGVRRVLFVTLALNVVVVAGKLIADCLPAV